MKKYLFMLLIFSIIIVTFLPIYANNSYSNIKAKVVLNNGVEEIKKGNDIIQKVQNVRVRLLKGDYQKEEYDAKYILSENINTLNSKSEIKVGSKVLVDISEKDGEVDSISIQEVIRQNYIIYLVIIMFALLLITGRKKSIKSILIFLTIIVLVYIMFAFVAYKGFNLILTSSIIAILITIIISVIIQGLNKRAVIMIFGTIFGVCISILLGYISCYFMGFSGELFSISTYTIQISGIELVYSGIIMSSMGGCIGATTSIISYLDKQKQEDKNVDIMKMFKNSLNSGMDFINKIIIISTLLYLCGISTLILIFTSNSLDIMYLINNELILTIILYLIILIIGAIITVLITSIIYIIVNTDKTIYKSKSDNIIEGQRSLKL